MTEHEKLVNLVKILIEEQKDAIEPATVKDIVQSLIAVSNLELPLYTDISQCMGDDYLKTDALFYAASSILSGHILTDGILKAATEGMMSAGEHSQEKRNNALCIAATGGEKSIRTLYVTIPVGIICSLYMPTVVQGNRAVTGCGCGGYAESDMMEYFEYPLYLSRELAENILSQTSFFYAHAQTYHPILRRFARERGVIGFRDIFKIATGLSDPFRCEYQYLCVWTSDLLKPSAEVFNAQDHVTRAVVTSGDNIGYDELPISGGKFLMSANNNISTFEFPPLSESNPIGLLGPEIVPAKGPDIEKEANSIKKILDPTCIYENIAAKRDLIIVNAALALWTVKNTDFNQLIQEVKTTIKNGTALNKFNTILENIKLSRQNKVF